AAVEIVAPDYFQTLGAAVSGRDFNRFDHAGAGPVAIVNQRFASEHWLGQNPLGQRIRLFEPAVPEKWLTVIGIAPNIIYDPSRQAIAPVIYVPYAQTTRAADMWILVRSDSPASKLAGAFRREVGRLDPGVIIWLGPFDVSKRLAAGRLYGDVRNHPTLLLIFAALALVLAAFG